VSGTKQRRGLLAGKGKGEEKRVTLHEEIEDGEQHLGKALVFSLGQKGNMRVMMIRRRVKTRRGQKGRGGVRKFACDVGERDAHTCGYRRTS